MAKRTKDEFTRDWIIENSVEILSRYEPGVLTIRALHYQLVSIGMTNTLQHYKRVLTFLYELSERMRDAISNGKQPIILYFGDYDPSGEDIPRSIGENLEKFGVYGVEIRRIALMEQQVIEWGLPPAPAKETDSRTANWDGLGQVELDAVKPEKLIALLDDAINEIFDQDLYDELIATEAEERELFQAELKRYVEEDL